MNQINFSTINLKSVQCLSRKLISISLAPDALTYFRKNHYYAHSYFTSFPRYCRFFRKIFNHPECFLLFSLSFFLSFFLSVFAPPFTLSIHISACTSKKGITEFNGLHFLCPDQADKNKKCNI